MKKFILAVVVTAMAMTSSTAWAQGFKNSSDRRMAGARTERVDKSMKYGGMNRAGDVRHKGAKQFDHKRPMRGARFNKRPIGGTYFYSGAEKYWIANGVIYQEIRLANGAIAFIVVGYL